MTTIKTVAVAGASGTVGPHVVKALVEANFQVTVLTRTKRSEDNDLGVKEILEVDFTSVESLITALKGVDAIVSTVGSAAIENQITLIDAAVAAGVKRFIPSEYGSCTTDIKLRDYPLYNSMFKVKDHLQEKATSGRLTWSVLGCGAFLEFVFHHPILLDFSSHKATLFDGGNNRLSSTSLPVVGKAIANILKNPQATENKVLQVSEVTVTQNELIKTSKELRPEIDWELSEVSTKTILEEAVNKFHAGDYSMPVILGIIKGTACAGDRYRAAFDTTDNGLLGVTPLTQEDVKGLISASLASK